MTTHVGADYRRLRAEDEKHVLALWSADLAESGADPARLRAEFRADSGRSKNTLVAADPCGRILSAAWYEPRLIRDVDGEPRRVACVAAVATRSESRGYGHASRLMDLLAESARSESCEWAMLFTRVPEFYERLGWRRMRTRYRQELLAAWQTEGSFDIRPLSRPRACWQALASIHAAYNARRPLTLVRDDAYWQRRLAARLASPGGQILVAHGPASYEPVGYAVVGWYPKDEAFEVYELCVCPGAEQAIPDLLGAVTRGAARRRIVKGRVYLPCEPQVDSALARLFPNVYTEWWELTMARPVGPNWTHERLQALFEAPGAIFWPLDDF